MELKQRSVIKMSAETKEIFKKYSYKLRIKKNKLLKEYKDKLNKQEQNQLIEYYKLLNINYIEYRTDEEIWKLYDEYNDKRREMFIDILGYYRYSDDNKLVHRDIAYNEIYLKNKNEYPLNFSEYVVHHKDRNKLNYDVSNLQILALEEHNNIHKFEYQENYEDEREDQYDEYNECQECGRRIKNRYILCYECNQNY